MNTSLIPATVVTILNIIFALTVASQYQRRPRPYKLVWAMALIMAAIGAGSFVLSMALGGNATFFRLYYLFGAAINVGWLGMGTLYLMLSRRTAHIIAAVLGLLSVIEAVLLLGAPIDRARLQEVSNFYTKGTPIITQGVDAAGKHVLVEPGAWLILVIVLPILGTLALVGGALLSAFRSARQEGFGQYTIANLLMAIGGGLIATAGSLVRYANGQGFWFMTALGFIVLFIGFLLTNRPVTANQPSRLEHRSALRS